MFDLVLNLVYNKAMVTVNIHKAKTELSKLLKRVEAGETVVIARAGRPVAKIEPYNDIKESRVPGTGKGKIKIKDEFFEPLPEDILKSFEK